MRRGLHSVNLPLIALVFFNLLPSLGLRPWLFMALALVLIIYRFWLEIASRPMPPKYMLFLIQASLPILLWQKYQSLFGDESAGTWLTLLTCLKLFELRVKRDYFVVALLCFLTLMSALLLDQSLLLSVFLLADVLLIMAVLFAIEDENWSYTDWKSTLVRPATLLLKSLPLLVLVFVLFPRFSTGFSTRTENQARTGIADRLNPGSVSRLALSDELVFRATFLNGEIPARETLYWRGAILDVSGGLAWERSGTDELLRPPFVDQDKTTIEIYLEPGFDKFLFSLESTRALVLPNDLNQTRVGLRSDGIFELSSPLQTRERYYLEPGGSLGSDPGVGRRYLEVPDKPSKELVQFLAPYRGLKPAEQVARFAKFLQEGEFTYSLAPPAAETIEDFLFKTKTGFCEHFAATFATLLRHLGVPARVIVGFQGGSPSLLENYLTIRAFDAHAWIEYFDPVAGRWRRFDPTALVAPMRITLGGVDLANRQIAPSWVPVNWLTAYLKTRAFVDEVDAAWVGFLMRFDLARQKELLARIGMDGVLFRALPVFLILSVALVLAVLYFLESQRREPLTAEERLYRSLLNRLKKFKIEKAANEGPVTLLNRIQKDHRELAPKAEPIVAALIEARYGLARLNPRQIRDLRKAINSLTAS